MYSQPGLGPKALVGLAGLNCCFDTAGGVCHLNCTGFFCCSCVTRRDLLRMRGPLSLGLSTVGGGFRFWGGVVLYRALEGYILKKVVVDAGYENMITSDLSKNIFETR